MGICALQGDTCYGCGRTVDEITTWGTLSPDAQSAVWAELPGRMAAMGFKTFRLAASAGVVADFIGRSFRETSGTWRLVSPWIEGAVELVAGNPPDVDETDREVLATFHDGENLRLVKHDKVRVFGFASGRDGGAMDTVALVLPKGRAQRDMKDGYEARTRDGYTAVDAPDMFTRVSVRFAPSDPDVAAFVDRLASAPWTSLYQELGSHVLSPGTSFVVSNALGTMESGAMRIATAPPADDTNAPADLKISKAFVACAVFQAHDTEWLAQALAP